MSKNDDEFPIIVTSTAQSICPNGWASAQALAMNDVFIETLYPGYLDSLGIPESDIEPDGGPPVTEDVLRQRRALYDLQRNLLLSWLGSRGKWVWAK